VKYGVPLLIHLAETRDEVRIIHDQDHLTPVGYLESIGFWAPRTVAAHGVWVTANDIAILARRHVGISHNPESNMKLASGTAPIPKYLKAGVAVGLGTDGAASNNDLDMFEAMRQAAFLHKLETRDPQAIPAPVALEMATMGGARVLGLEREIGSLEAGKRADLIMVRLDRPNAVPLFDPVSQMVYALKASDVRDVMVNGKPVVSDSRILTLNPQLIEQKAAEYRVKISASLK
jgi:5-methylthioadenosine/S-adenosylhomocysteine deaminase